jgi:single-stranded DNA-binding protein
LVSWLRLRLRGLPGDSPGLIRADRLPTAPAVDGMGPGREVGYINVSVFGKAGQAAAEYLAKGWLVAVDGRLEYGEWETEGSKRHDYSVVGNVEFLAAPRPVEEDARPARKKKEPAAA